ncbi:MAG TPA: universal stress protein [Steroidobacteraceae bacterium]|nr:universal stress protein [Steroidobacteraceae bacterium]
MSRFEHILVIVDPSAGGRQSAVDKAALLAQRLGACVELLICDIESSRDDDAASALFVRKTHASNTQLLNLLDELAAPARAAGIDVTARVIYGNSLHDSLLDYLHGSTADLVVKHTHHHSSARRVFLRTTDWHLVRGCPMPLLLTKDNAWGQPPVVMAAVDPVRESAGAAALNRQILKWGASLAGGLGGDLHVVHTFVPTAFAAVVASGALRMTPEYGDALQVENSFRCGQIERLVGACGVRPERLHVEMGTPGDCLARSVAEYHTDVMVMGGSSHGRWHRMVAGSTASRILEALPCDVLIIRPTDDARESPR